MHIRCIFNCTHALPTHTTESDKYSNALKYQAIGNKAIPVNFNLPVNNIIYSNIVLNRHYTIRDYLSQKPSLAMTDVTPNRTSFSVWST